MCDSRKAFLVGYFTMDEALVGEKEECNRNQHEIMDACRSISEADIEAHVY